MIEYKCADCANQENLTVEFRGVRPLCAECCDRYDADQRERLGIDEHVNDVNDSDDQITQMLMDFITACVDEITDSFGPGEMSVQFQAMVCEDGSLQ